MTRVRSAYRSPVALQIGLALLALAIGLLLFVKCGLHPAWSYLLSINLITLIAYAYDKWAAPREGRRIPERTLHLLAAIGGTPAALAGQWLFHHKTRKTSFQIRFWLIASAQVLLVVVVIYFKEAR